MKEEEEEEEEEEERKSERRRRRKEGRRKEERKEEEQQKENTHTQTHTNTSLSPATDSQMKNYGQRDTTAHKSRMTAVSSMIVCTLNEGCVKSCISHQLFSTTLRDTNMM